jgi:hypothetical protein
MTERKGYLLRISPSLWVELQQLAASDLRSVNAEIEVLLREAIRARKKSVKANEENLDESP